MGTQPGRGVDKFRCPSCGVVAQQIWLDGTRMAQVVRMVIDDHFYQYRPKVQDYLKDDLDKYKAGMSQHMAGAIARLIGKDVAVATCAACSAVSVWVDQDLVHPPVLDIAPPNADMNEEIRGLYLEAAAICAVSPRGAAALLRLALQMLLKQLGKPGLNINADIKDLVAGGLSPKIQQSLDLLRVVGNNAVHPGQIEVDDRKEIAERLFMVLNAVAHEMITHPRELSELYNAIVPEETRRHIESRDGKSDGA